MGNRTRDEVMRCRFGSKAAPHARTADHTAKSISEGLRMEAQTAVIKLRDDDPLLRQPHLVSRWPAYLGFQQAKCPPGILKYTTGQVPAAGWERGREEGLGAELQPHRPQTRVRLTRATLTCEKRSDLKLLSG